MANEFKLSYTGSEINRKLGEIDNLAKKSELPSKISELINDSGYLTEHQSLDGFATEDYVDNQLESKQSIITGNVGDFVVIGADGKITTKTIPSVEGVTF